MKLHELEITNIRGIRHVTLKPNGKNFVIWGPNGSGKSAVVDAIDFLLQGRMARLEGEGTVEISTGKHGFHVDSKQSDAAVRAQVSVDGIPGTFEISRSLAKPKTLNYPAEHESQLRQVLEVVGTGQYVLTRREILRFITATGGDRAKWIQHLLRLGSLEEMRLTIGKAAGEAKKQLTRLDAAVDTEKAKAAMLLGLQKWDEVRALDATNVLRNELGGKPIAALDSGAVRIDLTAQQASARNVLAARLFELVETFDRIQAEDVGDLSGKLAALSTSIADLFENALGIEKLQRHQLIECGIEMIAEDGICPLCGAEWSPGELSARLSAELGELNQATKMRDDICTAISRVVPVFRVFLDNLKEIQSHALKLSLLTPESAIAVWVNELESYSATLNGASDDVASWAAISGMPTLKPSEQLAELLRQTAESAKSLCPEVTPQQKAWDALTLLSDSLSRLEVATSDASAARTLSERAECLSNAYNEARNGVLTALYGAVRGRFVALYAQLHKNDGEGRFGAVLEQDDAAVKFLVDFYGRGLYPPHAFHSEGHQDSMGICLYLALSEHINKGLVGVTVLDDVVMSVDADHRKSLCKVLSAEFEGHQFIITTHDRSWAQQLRTEGFVNDKGIKHFVGWTVENGPRVSEGDLWLNIAARLEKDDVEGAATILRSGMEQFFSDMCESIFASITYRASGDYTLGDYLPAAYGRFAALLGKAKASANSWGDKATVERLNDAESVATQCFSRTTAEQWSANKGIHFSRWHQLDSADMTGVVDAFKDMCAVFICPKCDSPISVTVSGRTEEGMRCKCQAINWNLVKKTPGGQRPDATGQMQMPIRT